MTPDEKLIDEFITQSLDILRLSAGESQLAAKRLAALQAALVAKLGEQNLPDLTKSKVNKVIADAEDIIVAAYTDQATGIDVLGIAEHVAKLAAATLDNVLAVHLSGDAAALPTTAYLDSVASDAVIEGHATSAWWAAQADDLSFKFAGAVRQGLINNETNQQIISRIVGNAGTQGIMSVARTDAATLVHTSVQQVANNARLAVFKKNSDVLKGVRLVATLDTHTCVQCAAYSGAEWDLDGNPINGTVVPFNSGCPLHFNCRCVLVGISKTFKELGIDLPEPLDGERASSSGPVPVNTTFNDYLNRMGKAFQDEVLGPGRAQLWRDGKITLQDLVNGQGNPLTLAELRAKA